MSSGDFVDSGRKLHFLSCSHCRHWLGEKSGKEICKAYPNGIPPEILAWTLTHCKPYPGDHGMRFEPKDTEAAKILAQWERTSD